MWLVISWASIPSTGHYLKRLRASIGQIWYILTFLSVLFRLRRPIFSYLLAAGVYTELIYQIFDASYYLCAQFLSVDQIKKY